MNKFKFNLFLSFIFFLLFSKNSFGNYFFCKSYLGPNKNFGDDQYSFKFGKVRWGEYKPYKFSLDRVHLTLLDFTSPIHLSNRYQCYKLKGIEYIDINMNLSLDLTLRKIKR